MECTEPGVLAGSNYYFATPSAQAKSLFYYILCAGSYRCAPGYRISRGSYDSILLMHLLEGECEVRFDGKVARARAGDNVLLNCYRPHEYRAAGNLRFQWLHFDGAQSAELAEAVLKSRGAVFPCGNPALFRDALNGLLAMLASGASVPEASVSLTIYTLLCGMVSPAPPAAPEPGGGAVGEAVRFMKSNLSAPLSVADVSRSVHVSPSHFTRMFRERMGCSPYEFLLNLRIDAAKRLLKSTRLSIAEIASETGFGSQSNFIYAFHEKAGMSPGKFRNIPV